MKDLSRRSFLTASTALGLTLPGILRARAEAQNQTNPTAVIFVSLGGGASHHETYDPKPDAQAEVRGHFQSIPTSVPGVRFCELLPQQAALMNDLAVVRSIYHHEASHIALHMVETGYYLRSIGNAQRGEMPSLGAVVSRVRGDRDGLPAFVSIPRPQGYSGAGYLGGRFNSFNVDADPSLPDFRVGNLTLARNLTTATLDDRQSLLRTFDAGRRVLDRDDQARSIDAFQRQALELITGDRARTAFDLDREPERLRDRYGRTALGQRLLLSRRLVEAGVPFVHVRTFDWDDHDQLPSKMKARCPIYDTGMSALIRDLKERGMHRDVLVVAMGEFGRTPLVNPNAGRDHWPSVMSALIAGGRYQMGQAIGASDARGAQAVQSRYAPQQFLSMVYRHLGIDPGMTFNDHTGRPRHLLEEREPIVELG